MYVCTVTPCGVWNAQGALLKSVRYLHMALFCEHKHMEGCPSVMYTSVITCRYVCTVTSWGVLNAQGALLKSQRCVTQCVFAVLLFLLFEKIPTQNKRSTKENKQQKLQSEQTNMQ